jgi:thioredoxin reductase (NADPH)
MRETVTDLLVVGAGPTGIALGAEARQAGLDVLLVDRGPLCGAIVQFPTGMTFFTTRDLLEIAGIPFGIPEDKPSRRQALAYYQGVARRYQLPLALYEDVVGVRREDGGFVVSSRHGGETRERRARAVALATGYFDLPEKLGVPGEDLPWVHHRYLEPYPHFGQHVAVVGGGNSACEAALDLWRNHVRVTLLVRKPSLKPTVKYWVKPDAENRISEGSIDGRFETEVKSFADGGVEIEHRGRRETIAADAVYVLVGYLPDAGFERRCGIEIDAETLVPSFDPETCESNVPGLYVAGTLQAGRDTGRIFIENSRAHAPKIVRHLARRLSRRHRARPEADRG